MKAIGVTRPLSRFSSHQLENYFRDTDDQESKPSGQLENINQKMDRLEVNNLVICETMLPNNGDFVIHKHRITYAGRVKNEKVVGCTSFQPTRAAFDDRQLLF